MCGVGQEWLGMTQISGGQKHLEASSVTCLVSGLGCEWKAGTSYWSFSMGFRLPHGMAAEDSWVSYMAA